MIRRIRLLRPLLVIAAAVAAFGLTALPASAAGSGQPRVTTHAIKLTPQQVQALRRAHAANPHLSVAQARMAINSGSTS